MRDKPDPWTEDAACARPGIDLELFYPVKGGTTRPAKLICAICPVKVPCLNTALRNEERYGVWGGLSERERRRLVRIAAA